jgi:hypothetical protein
LDQILERVEKLGGSCDSQYLSTVPGTLARAMMCLASMLEISMSSAGDSAMMLLDIISLLRCQALSKIFVFVFLWRSTLTARKSR